MYKFNSSFWLTEVDDDIATSFMDENQISKYNLYKLNKNRRAISNFVSILTGKQIPVTFNVRGNSYTDGSSVVISSALESEQEFDVACGLSLHEASHILLSDFTILSELRQQLVSVGIYNVLSEKASEHNIDLLSSLKMIMNVIEDRRIDYFVYSTSPGYREYYKKMYDKYFNDKVIEKALRSNEFTTENWESYEFRLINLHSNHTRLNALRGLREIYNLIDLKNIKRINHTLDTFKLSIEVMILIFRYLDLAESTDSLTQNESGDTENSKNDKTPSNVEYGEGGSNDDGELSNKQSDGNGETETDENDSDGNGSDENGSDEASQLDATGNGDKWNDSKEEETVTLTDRQKESIKSKINKQKKFLNGDVSKRTISKSDKNELEVIDSSNSEIINVDVLDEYDRISNIDVVFAKKLTRELIDSPSFPIGSRWSSTNKGEAVTEGLRLGMLLGRKLQVRSESKNTMYSRQTKGKIDKRLISSIGTGNENIFYYNELEKYNAGNIHISVDASGSMGGKKWHKTMANVVAIAKAVDMIPNLEIQITFRSTISLNSEYLPYVLLAYDSRVDKFRKVLELFPYISPGGTTPEGLVFHAIMDYMVESNTSLDSIFLNLSDGQPYFSNKHIYYSHSMASTHTRAQIKKMEDMGLNILSYFIGDGDSEACVPIFDSSYGTYAKYIDVNNMNAVSQTINKIFLKKD